MNKLGVFICHCGVNIAGTVDVKATAAAMAGEPDVAHAAEYIYMCSEPGQALIREAVGEKGLTGLVVACCSPTMHENTFRKAARTAGVNPYRCEIANIREQCAWVHQKDKEGATRKAQEIIRATLEKLRLDEELEPIGTPVTRRALVVGGGVAGMTAALDLADGGYEVDLVERTGSLGGRAALLSYTFPDLEPASAVVGPMAARVASHPKVAVRTDTEVAEVRGYVGNFDVTLRAAGGGEETVKTGAIVVATGAETYPLEKLGEYGAGTVPDVIDAPAFERMLAPDGPTGGMVLRPSDGKVPREVVFVQCVASRDPDRHLPYCSRVCCMYTAKEAALYRRQVPDGRAYVFNMDVRSDCKGYEEFLQQTVEEQEVLYLRGRVSRVYREGDRVRVLGTDTLSGRAVEVAADLVVLATALVPSAGAKELAERLRATADRFGFLTEAHIKLYPVESSTRGIYLAGCGQGPKDISDAVAQASAAAGKIQALLSSDTLVQEPLVARVEPEICSGCAVCVSMCPYEARSVNQRTGVSEVQAALCQGCGACVAACPNKACELRNSTSVQVLGMVEAFIPSGGRGGAP